MRHCGWLASEQFRTGTRYRRRLQARGVVVYYSTKRKRKALRSYQVHTYQYQRAKHFEHNIYLSTTSQLARLLLIIICLKVDDSNCLLGSNWQLIASSTSSTHEKLVAKYLLYRFHAKILRRILSTSQTPLLLVQLATLDAIFYVYSFSSQ